MSAKTRIILADDHPIFLAGLRDLIRPIEDLELCGSARTGPEALKLITDQMPDVALLDISMPGLNGIILTRRLTEEAPSVRVLILTLHEDRAYLRQALAAGARGFVLKRSAAEILVHAIRGVVVGGLYVDPAIVDRVFEPTSKLKRRAQIATALPELTNRELEVLKFAALGFTGKEIARRLAVGVKSVETYRARGAGKLGLKSRAEIVRYAAAQGWLAEA